MKVEDIKIIAELMSENDLTEVKLNTEEFNICLKRGNSVQTVAPIIAPVAPQIAVAQAPVAVDAAEVAPVETVAAPRKTIDAPLVGTFYLAGSPDAAPFVKVGDTVNENTTVCIVEAMKVMNEIKAEKNGVIKEILVDNAQAVEYGQALFVIE